MTKRDRVHPEDVKAAIRKRGASLTQVARELGVTPQMVSHNLRLETHRSRRVEAAIARAAGMAVHEIWPQRYLDVA